MERSHRPRSGELMRDHQLAREPRRPRSALPAARREGRPPEGRRGTAEDASVRGGEGLRAGGELLGRGARRRDSSASRELDAAAKGGSRLPADLELERALVDVTRPRGARVSRYRSLLAGGEARGLRLATGRGVPVEPALGGGPVEPADELPVTLADRTRVARSAASLRRRMSVLDVERQRRFDVRSFAAWRTRFSCCLMFGICSASA